jgi:hypothetical protein
MHVRHELNALYVFWMGSGGFALCSMSTVHIWAKGLLLTSMTTSRAVC